MLNEIAEDAQARMQKSLDALATNLKKIRTGRAHPSILETVQVNYYGSNVPLSQVANISVEDGRTLSISPWESNLVPDIEKAIYKSDLGLNPSTAGAVIRVPMPALTEETRKGFIRQARQEAENGRVSVRSIRRDANGDIKDLLKEKEITEDESRGAEDRVQKLTDKFIAEVDKLLEAKEVDLMEI
ncbi:ribosome recycling factor [Amphritea sp. HPY]|uniref:ribosome recycling factor n=1 Tax=Amphritea sp. HPY TaxID=3421652 RepID=UPI003D7EFD8B